MGQNSEFKLSFKRLKEEGTYSAYSSLSNLIKSTKIPNSNDLRIAVLRNVTIEPLLPVIQGEAALIGHHPNMYVGDFDSIASDIFNSDSLLFAHDPEVIILFQWLEGLSQALSETLLSLTAQDVEDNIKHVLDTIQMQITAIRSHSSAPVLINNFPTLYRSTLGILEAQSDTHQSQILEKLNQGLRKISQDSHNIFCVDIASIFARIGISASFDDRHWVMARAPIGKGALVPVGQEYGRFIRAITGRTRKCLVLDCDGTLWGGIVGEDGIDGIRLGLDYPGNSFVAFQNEILNLYHRGVILAICSKNNEDDVFNVFRNHPNMVLKEDHFAAYRINWTDKAENLLSLANELNIGIDSIVFVDDTEFECNRIREAIPNIEVMHLNDQPSSFRRQLSDAGYFDSLTFTNEDKNRTASYKADQDRNAMQSEIGSLDDYLRSLDIKVKIAIAKKAHIPRVAQLSQKTNQFNLTTKRYTDADITELCEQDNSDVFYLWFADKFSEFGIVGSAIVKRENNTAHIDSFLFSCRALGRALEEALLIAVINQAIKSGCTQVTGTYIRTAKNEQVADFYKTSGFNLIEDMKDQTKWSIATVDLTDDALTFPEWIEVQ